MISRLPILLAVLLITQHVSATIGPLPLFMWSSGSSKIFSDGANSHVNLAQSLYASDLEHFVSALSHPSSSLHELSKKHVTGSAIPELIVAFVYPQMSSSEALQSIGSYGPSSQHTELNRLQSLIQSSASSLVAPYVYGSYSGISQHLIKAHKQTAPLGKIIAVDNASVKDENTIHLTDIQSLNAYLESHRDLLHNDLTDLVLINMKSAETAANALNLLPSLKDSNYVAIVTADHPSRPVKMSLSAENEEEFLSLADISRHASVSAVSVTAYKYAGPRYISSNILIALMIGFFLLYVLYIALSMLMSIERPLRMSKQPLIISREY